MEKFSQFRDRGSGISPFMPSPAPTPSLLSTLSGPLIFLLRLPFFLLYTIFYFLLLPLLPSPLRKLLLWGFFALTGTWWSDLQLDGVKRGSLSQQPPSRIPRGGTVIAANFTSPLDAVYLAAVWDCVFVQSFPGSRQVRKLSLWQAISLALSPRQLAGPPAGDNEKLTTIAQLLKEYPTRAIAVFPECATTNGKGILPLSPSLLTVPSSTQIFPLSLRYTPVDDTTPVPGGVKVWLSFLWKLLARPTHCIRIRIGEGLVNTVGASNGVSHGESSGVDVRGRQEGGDGELTAEEQRLLDKVAETLARLGRAKRVGLTVEDKKNFVKAWEKRRR
ncbi:hypothetical protein QR685DRAFT_482437 [Neurospora intermedia]|uniref:Phospholipid/glycerol acyltransferase domain-containing protein n=1 Tax=Neurospora intermedia TaxID=5142 RepID=A0ABR3D3J9_NEUIN